MPKKYNEFDTKLTQIDRRKSIGYANKAIVDEVIMDLSDLVRCLETINTSSDMLVRNQASFRAQGIVYKSMLKLKEIRG